MEFFPGLYCRKNIRVSDNLISASKPDYLPIFFWSGTGYQNLRDPGKRGFLFPGHCPGVGKAHFWKITSSGDKSTKRGFAGRILPRVAHWHDDSEETVPWADSHRYRRPANPVAQDFPVRMAIWAGGAANLYRVLLLRKSRF